MTSRVFWTFSLVILLKSLLSVAESVDWCQIEKKYCGLYQHLACFNQATDKYYCPDIKIINIPEEGKQQILHAYNKYRNHFAGGLSPEVPIQASRMMRVEWSDSLEYLSQVRIRRCKEPPVCSVGDRGQKLHAQFEFTRNFLNLDEQNTYKLYEFDKDAEKYMDSFLHDLKHDQIDVEIKGKEVTLTHLISFRALNLEENMNEIGCALGEFLEDDSEQKRIELYCHSLLNKNLQTQKVQSFEFGPPCSDCIEGQECSKEYPNLCENRREKPVVIPDYEYRIPPDYANSNGNMKLWAKLRW